MGYTSMIIRQAMISFCVAVGLTAIVISGAGAATADPPTKTVRVFYILPSDVPLDSAYPKGIAKVMISSQKYFFKQCGFTFRLNNPICEVVKGTHPRSWYENTPNPAGSTDNYWFAVYNGMDDLKKTVPSVGTDGNRSKWKIVEEVDAEGTGAGGGGGGGEVLLCKHDADGAKGYPKDTARWCGGMCHELGHCFGLPDASHDDGTVMSADFYHWPVNCIFTTDQVNKMKNLAANSGFWVDNITGTKEDFRTTMNDSKKWTPLIRGNQLEAPSFVENRVSAVVVLYDLCGKQVSYFKPSAAALPTTLSFDVSGLSCGNYVCTLEKNGEIKQKNIVRKMR
jgi:hypothetical protein